MRNTRDDGWRISAKDQWSWVYRTSLLPPLLPPTCSLIQPRARHRCSENIPQSNKNLDLLSIEKASAAASAASATSNNTPRKSRPITTLFLLTVVSFLPSFHHCVRAHHHHHHPVCSSRHHRCQPLGITSFFSPSLACPLAGFLFFSLSFSLLCLSFSREYRSTTTTTIRTAVGWDGHCWNLARPRGQVAFAT